MTASRFREDDEDRRDQLKDRRELAAAGPDRERQGDVDIHHLPVDQARVVFRTDGKEIAICKDHDGNAALWLIDSGTRRGLSVPVTLIEIETIAFALGRFAGEMRRTERHW